MNFECLGKCGWGLGFGVSMGREILEFQWFFFLGVEI